MVFLKRTQEALSKTLQDDPRLKPIINNIISTSSVDDIEYSNKFEAVMSILRSRGLSVDSLDPSDLEETIGLLMGAVLSMNMELTSAKSDELDIPLDVNPFNEDDILVSMYIERCENTFLERLGKLKAYELKDLFKSTNYWKSLPQLDRWVQAKLLINQSAYSEYEPLAIWTKLADSYGLIKG